MDSLYKIALEKVLKQGTNSGLLHYPLQSYSFYFPLLNTECKETLQGLSLLTSKTENMNIHHLPLHFF